MPKKRRSVPLNLLRDTILQHPTASILEIQKTLRERGYRTSSGSIRTTRYWLRKTEAGRRVIPREGEFSRINPRTGVPLNKTDRAAQFLLRNPTATAKEVVERFGIGMGAVVALKNRLFGKPPEGKIREAGSAFSPIDPKTGEPTIRQHRIQKTIIKHPKLTPAQIARRVKGVKPQRVSNIKTLLRKKGFKIPKLKPSSRPRKRR